jgi:hypothetical protein
LHNITRVCTTPDSGEEATVDTDQWQVKLDEQFPHGAVAKWTSGQPTIYQVAWIYVQEMVGLDPVITLVVWPSRLLEDMQVTSWSEPDGDGLVHATFLHEADGMSFSAAVTDTLAKDMAPLRQRWIADHAVASGIGPGEPT